MSFCSSAASGRPYYLAVNCRLDGSKQRVVRGLAGGPRRSNRVRVVHCDGRARSVLTVSVAPAGVVHRLEHLDAAGLDEGDQEGGGDGEEDDVQHGVAVEGDVGVDDLGVTGGGDEAEGAEHDLDDVAGGGHGGVEGGGDEQHHAGAVVLAIDGQDGQDDEVGEDEARHATEADPPVPK